jgi:hypothetical protein
MCSFLSIVFFHYLQPINVPTTAVDGPVVNAHRRAIAEVKQRWSAIGWVTKNLLSRAPTCFGRHVKPLTPAAFPVVSTHQPALGARGGL